MDDLERRAIELDLLLARERTVEHLAEESTKRRFLLLDLEATGLFDLNFSLPANLARLQRYRDAGRRVAEYLRSEERFRFNPEAVVGPVVGSPVSLDWFRFVSPGPAHLTPIEWLAYAENLLTHGGISGGQGDIFARAGDEWWTLGWRCDDGIHPALVSAKR
jgi:hypothetical protein